MNEDANARTAASLATLFGVGRVPSAPGTAASVIALPFAWLIAEVFGRGWVMFAAVVALAAGTWACELYSRAKGEPDPKECVIDELAGQWIVCAFAPLSLVGFFLAFILFRLFDILKPWPIGLVQRRVPGGLGIMADDVVAAVMASVIIAILGHLGVI